MDKKGIAYSYVDITEDAEAMQIVTELGYRQVPVVVNGDDHWGGFRPDKIGALAASAAV
jgi:glutaredoxin-like protein NrdH